MRILKGVLLISVLAAAGSGAAALPDKGTQFFPLAPSKLVQGKAHAQPLRKGLAKMTALAWMQIGATYYVNDATMGDPVDWAFTGRDTTVYDANGNEILYKQSAAGSGWAIDSLQSMDSMAYSGGGLTSYIHESFSSTGDTVHISGQRSTYDYPNGGKSFVETDFNWNDSKKTWVPYYKDSLAYSTAAGSNSTQSSFATLVGTYYWYYDTTASLWTTARAFAKVEAECNATTLTLGGQQLMGSGLVDAKDIVTFSSSVWTQENVSQEVIQVKDPSTGTYRDNSKSTRSVDANGTETDESFYWNSTTASLQPTSKDITAYDANGRETSQQTLSWDATKNVLVNSDKNIYYPDAHGNDTLEADYYFNATTQAWDTSSVARYARTYDANGNNLVVIESDYDPYARGWTTVGKTVYAFAHINTSVLRSNQPAATQRISVVTSAARVVVSAPNITGLVLYNSQGKIVASVKQRAAGSILLDLSRSSTPISSGIYIARLICGKEQSFLTLSIRR